MAEPTPDTKKELSRRAAYNWHLVRKAVNATRFWKRMANLCNAARASGNQVDLGSLKQFIDKVKVKDVKWTAREEVFARFEDERKRKVTLKANFWRVPKRPGTSFTVASGVQEFCALPPPPQTKAQLAAKALARKVMAGPRRQVARTGDLISRIRGASPRNQQLRLLLPKPMDAETPEESSSRPVTAPTKSSAKVRHSEPHEKNTVFTMAMLGGKYARPQAETHPLLIALEGMQQDEVSQQTAVEPNLLAQQLDLLRWGELRRGAWTAQPERLKPVSEAAKHKAQQERPPQRLTANDRALLATCSTNFPKIRAAPDIHGDAEEMEMVIALLDPEHTGVIPPDALVPLMFWLGMTRKRSAALMTLKLAFGAGDIDTACMKSLARYAEVQIRLIEGLRQLARRESLEQLCEYITDMMRLRTWFHTMKQDTYGHADIVEVQNLFARMEVTSDRQALFRFLSAVVHSNALPSATADRAGGSNGGLRHRTFGIGDFASLLARCSIAWCLHRTLILLNPAENMPNNDHGEGPLLAPPVELEREVSMRWVALQRKIIISLLVNHRFWGRESRTVLMSLSQPQFTTLGNQLTPEQWLSLFQRVRAQGIASTLPVDDEGDDPDWLIKKAAVRSSRAVVSLAGAANEHAQKGID
mmetsp:Transcript_115379/g.182325  ORF Transcript_115379/g.182325 Transcript_115379/m.182325 type:complete len:644 (+) Transcript_115379:73-2004(+)